MFGFFKKRNPPNRFVAMLSLDDQQYVNVVSETFKNMDGASRAQILVAYKNLLPLISARYTVSIQGGDPFTVEKMVSELAKMLESSDDEISSYRWSWFLLAAVLARVEKLSRQNKVISEIGGNIWCSLAEDAPCLKHLLPNSGIWKPEEKGWFDLTQNDDDVVQDIINHHMPPIFSKLDQVKDYCESNGLIYFPSESRIGIVP